MTADTPDPSAPVADQATLVVDAERRVTLMNGLAEHLTGWLEFEALGKLVEEIVPIIDLESRRPVLGPVQEAFISRSISRIPANSALIGRNGATTPVAGLAVPVQDRESGMAGAVLFVRDNERERHLHAYRSQAQALEALRATLDALTSHIAVLDERGVILITNRAWRVFAFENGLPWPRVGEGVNYLAVCDGASGPSSDEASAAANAIRDVVAQPSRTFSFEYPCHSPTQNRWFLVRVTGFVTHGAPRVVVSHQDITSRKVAEAARATAQRMFEGLFEYAPDAMVMVKGDGLVGLVNRQAELLFGYDRQELLEGTIEALLPELALAGHVVKRRRFLEAGVPRMVGAAGPALRGRKRNGAEFPVEISLSTLDGEGVVAAIRDITDRVRVEEQLRAAQRLETVGRLAGGIAHDFNNILSVINVTADRARLAVPDAPEGRQLREDLDAIREAGERAAALTQQLLAFSRRQALQPIAVDIESAVRKIEPMLQRLVGTQVSLVVSVVEPTLRVLVDPTQLEQVILNLAVNACDAMPHGGILTIQLARASVEGSSPGVSDGVQPEHYACLAVTDTGTGMDESTRRRVFEPFFTTKGLGHGVGLGLATVFGIVKQCGGEILCESEQGQGTTFRVYLPLTDTAIPESVASAEASTTSGTETILVIEDQHEVRRVAGRILREQGYTVLVASNSEEALQVAAQYAKPIHVILTDVVMPGMSGPVVTGRIKETHPEARVLFTSGYSGGAVVRQGMLALGVHFLQKPYAVPDLSRMIRAVLDA